MKTPESTLPTSEEIDRRLNIVAQLRNLCLSLGQAKSVTAESTHPLPENQQVSATD